MLKLLEKFLPQAAGAVPSATTDKIVFKTDEGFRFTRHDSERSATFVVWHGDTIIASAQCPNDMQERFQQDEYVLSVYSSLARGALWILATTLGAVKRMKTLDMYNDFVEQIANLDDYADPRAKRAVTEWRTTGDVAHHNGNETVARAEALFLAFPTFNYEVISKTVNDVRVDAMVHYGVPGIRFLFSHKTVDEEKRAGQELKRWYTYPLDGHWADNVNEHINAMMDIAGMHKEQEPVHRAHRPTQPFKCVSCQTEYDITPMNREDIKIRCRKCGHDQVVPYCAK